MREVKVLFDTSQLDDKYVSIADFVDLYDKVDNQYYRIDEIDSRLYDSIGPLDSIRNLTTQIQDITFQCNNNTISLSEILESIDKCRSDISILQDQINIILTKPKEVENPFYEIFETVYKK